MDPLAVIGADIFLRWLNDELGCHYELSPASGDGVAADGDRLLAISVHPLFEVDSDPAWSRRCQAVAAQLKELGVPPLSLWLPLETDITHGYRTDFVRRIVDLSRIHI